MQPTLYPFVQCVPPPWLQSCIALHILDQPAGKNLHSELTASSCRTYWLHIAFTPRPCFARAPLSQWLSTAEVFKLGHSWTLGRVWLLFLLPLSLDETFSGLHCRHGFLLPYSPFFLSSYSTVRPASGSGLSSSTLTPFSCDPSQVFPPSSWTSNSILACACLENPPNYCYSVAKLCPTLCDPMDSSRPSFPVHHHLPELAETHVHWVGDAIQPSHPLSSSSPSALSISQLEGLLQWLSSSHQLVKVLELQLQHHSFQRIFRVHFL